MQRNPVRLSALLILAGCAVIGFYSKAQADSLFIDGGTAYNLPAHFDPSNTGAVDMGSLGVGATVRVFTSFSPLGTGLKWDGPSTVKLTYTYIGFEAAYSNQADADPAYNGDPLFNNHATPGGTSTTRMETIGANGLIPFSFTSLAYSPFATAANGGAINPSTAIAFYLLSATTGFALFEDIWPRSLGSDKDFDDMVLKIEISPVPVPAALPLFAGGLGMMAWWARRRKRKATAL